MKKILLSLLCMFLWTSYAVSGMPLDAHAISVGEHQSYEIKWLGVQVGTLDVRVREEVMFEGREVYVIEMKGGTNRFCSLIYKIRDSFVTYVDKETLLPLKLEVSRREGFYKKDAITTFDHEKGTASFYNYLDKSSKDFSIPSDTQDIVSVFFRLRQDRFAPNEQLTYNVVFAETVFSAYGSAEVHDDFEVKKGRLIPAFISHPRAKVGEEEVKDGSVQALFSADDYKVPLKITLKAPLFTQLTMTLSDTSTFSM